MAKKSAKKILYIEDEVIFHKIYGDSLKEAGFELTMCKNGEEALEAFNKGSYDLIIVDLIMPIMGGELFLKSLKGKKPKIIVLTTLTGNTDKMDAKNAGASLFLEKHTTSPDELVKAAQELTKK